tara:strand:- start:1451 stop:1657 length:207 start_codon:yes stop_codon:yes gene_type:complete
MKKIYEGKLVRNIRTDSIGLIISSDDEKQFFKVLTKGKNGIEVDNWFRSNLEEIKNESTKRNSRRYIP